MEQVSINGIPEKPARLQCFACVGQTNFLSNIKTIFFFKTSQIYMKVQNRLNRKKNQISDFSDIYFSSYDHFCSKNCQFSMNFNDNSRNKNRKIVFFIRFSTFATLMKVGSKLRVGSLHVVSWDKAHLIFFYQDLTSYCQYGCCR